MADGVTLSAVTEPAVRGIRARQTGMPRAAMWALRQAGRQVKQQARRAAPVLKDQNLTSVRQIRKAVKAGGNAKELYGSGKPIPGLLRDSIRSSRSIKRTGPHTYQLTVGPRSSRSILYAAKMEAKYGYMAQGQAAGEAAIEVAAVEAFHRVWQKPGL